MSVLLLRLAGPMQSWGTRSRFSNRDTGLEPSKSGVVGLLCAAARHGPAMTTKFAVEGEPVTLEAFARSLKMAVRVDREGRLMRDYHTAQEVRRADTSKGTQETVLSERFYLADADFLVGLHGDDRPSLERLAAALQHPVWQLALGRKAFVPAQPVVGREDRRRSTSSRTGCTEGRNRKRADPDRGRSKFRSSWKARSCCIPVYFECRPPFCY